MATVPPWLAFYGEVPPSLSYPDATLYEALAATAARVPGDVAWEFFATRCSYRDFLAAVDRCAAGLAARGLARGDRLLVSMPTTPQAVIAFYAANRLGAVAAMIHPLSTAPEIAGYLDASGARMALVLDAFCATLLAARPRRALESIIVARIPDYLPRLQGIGFWLAKGRRIAALPKDARLHAWRDVVAAEPMEGAPVGRSGEPAAILFSGGTTGHPKGIVLSNRNFICEGMQAAAWGGISGGDSILAILPLFHGFGLGVCVNAAFMAGGRSILVPTFDAKGVAKLMRTKRPNILVGVPTLYDALANDPSLERADLSCIKACFSGADRLPRAVKERFEGLVARRGGKTRLLEGYGLTEAVTAIIATPLDHYREGSIGVPFPDMLAAICRPGSSEAMPVGEEGEICVAGPDVMMGYLDDAEATAQALRTHEDGRTWLHTGDLGRRDADGFFYFSGRLKRLIKSSGFNVNPAQVEATLCEHPAVREACVVGVPDPAQVERVKAFVVLAPGAEPSAELCDKLIAHCRERLIKWSCPREVEFRTELPRTRIGKIDYRALMAAQG